MKNLSSNKIICYGETLWDILPSGMKPGGAPMNVAVHMKKFGIDARLISRIGDDELGEQLISFLSSQKMDTSLIQVDGNHPTGTVNVEIGQLGNASYEIVFPSAWDFIEIPEEEELQDDMILVFGSLASRNTTSKNTLIYLLEKARLSLFDVNFRAPHYTRELIELLLNSTDIVKINEDEIDIIAAWIGKKGEPLDAICRQISADYAIDHIIVTLGGEGALVYCCGEIYRHSGIEINVVDTVGSGDSFLAAYLSNFMRSNDVPSSLEIACATGAFVATQDGANPNYTPADIKHFLNQNRSKSYK